MQQSSFCRIKNSNFVKDPGVNDFVLTNQRGSSVISSGMLMVSKDGGHVMDGNDAVSNSDETDDDACDETTKRASSTCIEESCISEVSRKQRGRSVTSSGMLMVSRNGENVMDGDDVVLNSGETEDDACDETAKRASSTCIEEICISEAPGVCVAAK
eukprot:TRINITY_DN12089_c0_g1_i1.p3 TRINITY_DN12089_c0_g1~~TRINITY_DN12089_c0_g1_i1.p3  ORF type:complete len:157 (+),score=30.06 TRINITY_DN12089_c0_g1_i1:1059-1529(+)